VGDGMAKPQQNMHLEPVYGIPIPDEGELSSDAEISVVDDRVTVAPMASPTGSQLIRASHGDSVRAHMPIVAVATMAQNRLLHTPHR
jgi:hypothetical protein